MGFLSHLYDVAKYGEIAAEWEYLWYCGIFRFSDNRGSLTKKIRLKRFFDDLCEHFSISPLVDEVFAYEMMTAHGAAVFSGHEGTGYTLDEFYGTLVHNLLCEANCVAGYYNDELGIASINDYNTLVNPPVIHAEVPVSKAPYEMKISTFVMVGDVLNVMSYHLNRMKREGSSDLDEFFESVIYTLGSAVNLTETEMDKIIEKAKVTQKKYKKGKRSKTKLISLD